MISCTVAREWECVPLFAVSRQRFCNLNLMQNLFGSSPKSRAKAKIEGVGDISFIFVAIKNVNIDILSSV